MKSIRISALLVFLSVPVPFTASCVGPRRQPESAIFCPKCEMVWVEMTDFDDPYRMSTVPGQVMKCPDCENAVVHFFKTGKLEHACSTCGGELVHCKAH